MVLDSTADMVCTILAAPITHTLVVFWLLLLVAVFRQGRKRAATTQHRAAHLRTILMDVLERGRNNQ